MHAGMEGMVISENTITAFAAGLDNVCALFEGDETVCWGSGKWKDCFCLRPEVQRILQPHTEYFMLSKTSFFPLFTSWSGNYGMLGDGLSKDTGTMEQIGVICGSPGSACKAAVEPAYPPGRCTTVARTGEVLAGS